MLSNSFIVAFGSLEYIPNNGYSNATPPISMHVLAVYATHAWFSGSLAFNHHVMAGTDGTIVRVYNSRIINNDTKPIYAYWLALGKLVTV